MPASTHKVHRVLNKPKAIKGVSAQLLLVAGAIALGTWIASDLFLLSVGLFFALCGVAYRTRDDPKMLPIVLNGFWMKARYDAAKDQRVEVLER